MMHDDNAVTALAEAVARLGAHRSRCVHDRDGAGRSSTGVGEATGLEFDPATTSKARSPSSARSPGSIGATLRNTANPTMLDAGYKANVIPSDGARPWSTAGSCPGARTAFERRSRRAPRSRRRARWVQQTCRRWRPTFDGDLVAAMDAALPAEDPGARTGPYMLSGGTDAKAFSRLGMRCFGFAPLRLPPDLDFAAMFHGVDERVPVDGLTFGARVLDRFLRSC